MGADSLPVRQVARFAHASRRGGSHALVVVMEDGRMALVKFKGNPQSSRALVGDLVGTLLGRRVGAAFPEPVLVRVPFSDLIKIPPLRGRRWIPGIQFGTVFHAGAQPIGDGPDARNVDLDRLPVTALVELWLHNGDLKVDHLLRVGAPCASRLLVVDHGHILPGGPSWTAPGLGAHVGTVPDVALLTGLARASGRRFDFSNPLARCASVRDEEIAGMLGQVPGEWGLSQTDADALTVFLTRRRALLEGWARSLDAVWHDAGLPT